MSADKSNAALVTELRAGGYATSPEGYYLSRGYDSFPGWENLPFADFFENISDNDGNGHKKMWLDPTGKMKAGKTTFECDSLLPLYEGIQETLRNIVSNGFFMYSSLVVSMHLNLAYYSKKLGCSADVMSVMAAGDETVKQAISDRALAARICAYIIYEGDGLGGYADKVWPLWGRLTGKACPCNSEVLSVKDAMNAKLEWDNSTDEQRKELFISWWYKIDSAAHKNVSRSIVEKIFVAYKQVKRYQQMENPFCREDDMFDPNSSTDVQAAICGFFRRSSVGMGEARCYDANELDNPANRFCDMLLEAKADVIKKLTGQGGSLTPFGQSLLTTLELTIRRNDIVDGIVERQNDDEQTKQENRSFGLASRVSKRGRARLK